MKAPRLNESELRALIGQRFKKEQVQIIALPRYERIDNVDQLVALCKVNDTLAFCAFSIKEDIFHNAHI